MPAGFTLKSLLSAWASDFAMLGIDPYVAKLVRDAVKRAPFIVKIGYTYDQEVGHKGYIPDVHYQSSY